MLLRSDSILPPDWNEQRLKWEHQFFSPVSDADAIAQKFTQLAPGHRPDTLRFRAIPRRWFGVPETTEEKTQYRQRADERAERLLRLTSGHAEDIDNQRPVSNHAFVLTAAGQPVLHHESEERSDDDDADPPQKDDPSSGVEIPQLLSQFFEKVHFTLSTLEYISR